MKKMNEILYITEEKAKLTAHGQALDIIIEKD